MLRAVLTPLTVSVALAVATGLAVAQPETLEGRQRMLAFEDDPEKSSSMQAFAQLAGGTSNAGDVHAGTGDVAAGFDLHRKGRNCTHARIGGQGRFGWNEQWQASAEQWASVCTGFAGIAQVGIGHHLEWDVQPSLLAPLGMRAGRNRRETITFRFSPFRMSRAELERLGAGPGPALPRLAPPPGELIVFDVVADYQFLWSPGGDVAFRGVPYVIPFGYRSEHVAAWGEERDFRVGIGTAGGEFVDHGSSVFFWITEIDNLRLGPVFVSGGAGLASAGAGEFVSDVEREVAVTSLKGKLGIETGTDRIHGYLRAESDATLAPDGYVAVERTLLSGASLALGRTKLALDGMFGRTKAYVPGQLRSSGLVGGGSLAFVRELSRHLRASVQVEVARGFYGADMATQDFAPRWGARAFGVLQAIARR